MDNERIPEIGPSNAWLVFAVKNGCLVVNANLPLRWMLVVFSALATATGYPTIVDFATKLLHAR